MSEIQNLNINIGSAQYNTLTTEQKTTLLEAASIACDAQVVALQTAITDQQAKSVNFKSLLTALQTPPTPTPIS